MDRVLDIVGQRLQAVNLAGKPRGDGRLCLIALFGHEPRGARGIRMDLRFQPVFAQEIPTLRQRLFVAEHAGQPLDCRALHRE